MLITPYFDPDFSMAEFKEGAKHAAVLIANSLAEGDLDQVKCTVYTVHHLNVLFQLCPSQVAAVVTPECLNMLQKNLRFGT